MESLDQSILLFLLQQEHPCTASWIATKVIKHDAKAKDVNPTLYKMKNDGLINYIEGRPPTWHAIKKSESESNKSEKITDLPVIQSERDLLDERITKMLGNMSIEEIEFFQKSLNDRFEAFKKSLTDS